MVLIKMANIPSVMITSLSMGISGIALVCSPEVSVWIRLATAKIKKQTLQINVNRDKNLIIFIIEFKK